MLYSKVKRSGIPLDNWCALRGYTQALEAVVMEIIGDQLTKHDVERFLEDLPKKLPHEFQKIGLAKQQGQYFAANLPEHITIAITQLLNLGVRPKDLKAGGFGALKRWIRQNANLAG